MVQKIGNLYATLGKHVMLLAVSVVAGPLIFALFLYLQGYFAYTTDTSVAIWKQRLHWEYVAPLTVFAAIMIVRQVYVAPKDREGYFGIAIFAALIVALVPFRSFFFFALLLMLTIHLTGIFFIFLERKSESGLLLAILVVLVYGGCISGGCNAQQHGATAAQYARDADAGRFVFAAKPGEGQLTHLRYLRFASGKPLCTSLDDRSDVCRRVLAAQDQSAASSTRYVPLRRAPQNSREPIEVLLRCEAYACDKLLAAPMPAGYATTLSLDGSTHFQEADDDEATRLRGIMAGMRVLHMPRVVVIDGAEFRNESLWQKLLAVGWDFRLAGFFVATILIVLAVMQRGKAGDPTKVG